jgi:hypothetical protein
MISTQVFGFRTIPDRVIAVRAQKKQVNYFDDLKVDLVIGRDPGDTFSSISNRQSVSPVHSGLANFQHPILIKSDFPCDGLFRYNRSSL